MGKHKAYALKGVLICMLSLSLLSQGLTNPVQGRVSLNKSVAGWLPYWDQARGFSVVQNNPDVFDELSPFWYDLGSSGELITLPNSEDTAVLNYAKTTQKKLIPLISNEFNGSLVSNVINNPVLKQKHISDIVNKVVAKGYNGIEIDYESVLTADKAAFTAFIQELAAALHAKGKTLIVTVQAKIKDSVTWNGPGAMDYAAIGKAADKVRIMAYDYHWNTSSAGSIAPVNWVNQVLAYAVGVIPPNKLVLGLPNYGYDWVGSQGKGITYSQAIATADAYNTAIIDDAQNGPHFTYNANGVMHEIWFINSGYYASLLDLVNRYNINGIAIWRLGGEDPDNYPI
ncbi:MAG TPA: glycosyl hydrolase family 18 protein, partial [Verrucomicrobiae bacterium]|nr:glycosyl hydrolase family 18 protein [Verrucomicrobiae bacterium]